MKIFSLLITLIFSLGISAQNWSPINLNVEYNYKTDTAQLITNTILVDSFGLNNNDTTFYLNRIMGDCDTCSTAGYKLINQPQFLMRQVLKKDDSLFIFQYPTEFKIYPLKNLNDSWLFDSTNSINAFIDSVFSDTIFGINDSLKRINLSNGSNIILSKSFGIIKFPYTNGLYYELIGINNSSLGEQVPNFWDFFDYDVNDILQWKYYNWCAGPGASNTTIYSKATVISKLINGDSVSYQVQGIERKDGNYRLPNGTWIADPTVFTPINTTLTYIDSLNHRSNSYPNETEYYQFSGININTPNIFFKENGIQTKMIDFINSSYYIFPPGTNQDPLPLSANTPPYSKSTTFTKGLGACTDDRYTTTCGKEECMQGRIHLGDTIGFVYPDSFYVVGIDEIQRENFKLYPNPVSNKLTIITNYDLRINKIEIVDLTGKILKKTTTNFNSVNVNELPSGVYFIKIITDDRTTTQKFVKQ